MRDVLIKKRKNKKLTQQEISKLLGIGRSTYSAYELGIIDPPLKIATKIKEILNYKNDDIFLNNIVSNTDNTK
ncbi:MAG: helix-turn-helix transcriptional regulator [Bacilli bacterium]|nr:helix-turn-helix transcriptional regulator [Bacilli bacterium]